jgi:hypothetical protein
MKNKNQVANSLLYILACVGILPALLFFAKWLFSGELVGLSVLVHFAYTPIVFAILFFAGVYLCVVLADSKKIILLLPLLCMAVLPVLSQRDKDQMPAGAVVAFNLPEGCPPNWVPLKAAEGRTIVGAHHDNVEGADSEGNKNLTTRKLLEQGGAETHKLSVAEMPNHNHNSGGYNRLLTITGRHTYSGKDDNTRGEPHLKRSGAIKAVGGNQPHNNMPPFVSLYYCQKQ